MRIEVARRLEDLALHAPAWDALAAAAAAPSPFRACAWFEAHVAHKLAPGEPWLALLAYDGASLRGVLPLVEAAPRTLGLRRGRWRVPGEYYTPEGDALLEPGLEPLTLARLLEGLAQAEPGALSVELGGIAPGSSTLTALGDGHGRVPAALEAETEGARLPVAGGLDPWLRSISENLRVNMRKARNRLEREHPGALAFRFLAGPDAAPALLDDFARLEVGGWKGEDGGALARSPQKLELYRSLVARWAARGWLEWHLALLGGRPVAMHMAVRLGRTLTLLRICYDESIAKHMPGNLLLREMAAREHADARCDAIDFVQTQPWNAAWRMERYPLLRARVAEPGLVPRVLGLLPARARAALQRVPGVMRLARRLRGG